MTIQKKNSSALNQSFSQILEHCSDVVAVGKELVARLGTGAVGSAWNSQKSSSRPYSYQGHTASSLISEASAFGGITHHFATSILKLIPKIWYVSMNRSNNIILVSYDFFVKRSPTKIKLPKKKAGRGGGGGRYLEVP